MITLNLLPEVKKEFIRAQKARSRTIAIAVLVTIVCVAATVLLALYVYAGQTLFITAQTADIKKKSQQLENQKDLSKYLTIQNQLSTLSGLHDDKNRLSRLLDFLLVLNPAPPKDARLNSLEVSTENKTIAMRGVVSDFQALDTFKDTLANAVLSYTEEDKQAKEALFSDVTIQNASYSESGGKSVAFSLVATYADNAFSSSIVNPVASVPNIETTPSTLQAPSIFGGTDGQ